MNIPGEHGDVVDAALLKHVQEPGARVGVTVPLICVQDGGVAVASELPQHDLLAEDSPAHPVALGALKLIVKPRFLSGTEKAALGVLNDGLILGVGRFPIPAIETRVEHGEIEQIPEAETAPNLCVPRALRFPGGQPFVPCLHRSPLPGGPGPFPLVVILCTIAPAVVGRLVVIPDHHHGMLTVQFLQIFVRAIEGVAFPVIGKGGDFPIRRMAPSEGGSVAVFAVPIFVNVVAEVEYEVEVVAPGHRAIGIEVAEEPVGAGAVGNAQAIDARAREGAGPTQRRRFPRGDEAIIVGAPGRQAVDNDLHGVIAIAMGAHFAALEGPLTLRVGVEGPAHGKGRALLLRGGAGPEYDAVLAGVPGGNAVAEHLPANVGGARRQRTRAGAEERQGQARGRAAE